MATLYHYTTAAGLIGILESKSFWASDTRFMEDDAEFGCGLDVLYSVVEDFKEYIRSASDEAYFLIESLLEAEMASAIAFVASFSREGDDAVQWRARNDGRGFALGMDADWLNINAIAQGFAMVPVVYAPDKQVASASAAVNFLITQLEDLDSGSFAPIDCVEQWWPQALKTVLAFKTGRSEEGEVLLVRVGAGLGAAARIRPGPAGLVPYLPCFIDRQSIKTPKYVPQNFGLAEVIVGPALKSHQVGVVEALLARQRMKLDVRKSSAFDGAG